MTVERRTYFSVSGTLDAAGAVTLNVGPVPLDTRWAVERIITIGGGAANPVLSIYRNSIADSNLVEGTASTSGNRDFADENSPVVFDEGDTIILRYTGGTVGAQVTANGQYRIGRAGAAKRVRRSHSIPGGAVAQWEVASPARRPHGQHPTAVS